MPTAEPVTPISMNCPETKVLVTPVTVTVVPKRVILPAVIFATLVCKAAVGLLVVMVVENGVVSGIVNVLQLVPDAQVTSTVLVPGFGA